MNIQEFRDSMTSYPAMSQMLKSTDYQTILENAAALGNLAPEKLEQIPMGGYSKGRTSGAYCFVLRDLLKNVAQYDWLYDRLADDTSRFVFANLIGYRLFPADSFLKAAYDGEHPQYFDKEIVSCDESEVFVDCGGFTGDTVEKFIDEFGSYQKIYVYEPSWENVQICRANLSGHPNIIVRPCGVGERNGSMTISTSGASSTFLGSSGAQDPRQGQVVSLDEDIPEAITFLKMDVEGFEIPALLGAKRHIREDFPKLAVCTYHIVSDMWEIPRLIDTIHPGYRFYIRHYDYPQNWETVIYAIPPEKKARQRAATVKKTMRIRAFNQDGGWWNFQLLKDCGVIPYLLYKNHCCDVSLVGGRHEECPNLAYVEGLKMEYLPDCRLESAAAYLVAEAEKIHAIILYGCYPSYYALVEIYKNKNPSGKVYLALDANSHWMDRIQWTDPQFVRFMEQCDVIGASGHTLQKHLSEKWPWKIDLFPNGFYNFSQRKWSVNFSQKENIILTVGRLGVQQKKTDVLLEAFTKIAGQIPDWKLYLAGGIDQEFEQGYLTQFWQEHPEVTERIQFLGPITDRHVLYDTYLRSKIFALTSNFEGGTPNVIAEALWAGNAIAITKIDEYADATDSGRCGLASEIGDIDGYADILLSLCQSDRLENMCCHAYAYAREYFDMERIVEKLYMRLFREETCDE